MKFLTKSLLVTALAALACATPSLRADTLTMTSPGDGVNIANIYVGPYQGTINGGAQTPIICDDFTHDSFVGETWQATATNLGSGNLSNTLYGAGAQTNYDVAAYLATELLAPSLSPTTQENLQYAIWYLFDPSQVTSYLASFGTTYANLLSGAIGDVTAAQAAEANSATALTAAQLNAFTIYTAVPGTGMCGATACNPATPQEFIVNTPEPSTLLMLGAGLGLLAMFVRRRKSTVGSMVAA